MFIVKRHPIGEKELMHAAPNRAVIEYLTDYDDQRDMEVDVYLNGGELLSKGDYKRVLKEGDILTLSYRPSGVEVVVYAVIAIVAALVLVSLVPKPETPNVVGETSSSPNNLVSGQSNKVRKYEAIPNIYGRVRSYPDLIGNPIPEWNTNTKQVREVFLIGEGEYQINAIRDSDTNISEIANSTATVYPPNTYPSDLKRVGFLDGISDEEMLAPDDASLVWSGNAKHENVGISVGFSGLTYMNFTGSNSVTLDFKYALNPTLDWNNVIFDVGESVSIEGTASNNGVKTVSSTSVLAGVMTINFVEATVAESAGTSGLISSVRDYILALGTTTVGDDLDIGYGSEIKTSAFGNFGADGYAVGGGDTYIILQYDESGGTGVSTATTIEKITGTGAVNTIGPYVMPNEAEQVWFNVVANSGLQSNDGGTISVSAIVYVQRIDSFGADVGAPISSTVTLTGQSSKKLGSTVKVVGIGGSRVKVYANRTTGTYTGAAIQTIALEEVFTVNDYSGANFGDVTVIDVITTSSKTESTSSRKINVDVTRKLNGVATTNFADAVKDLIVNKGNRPESEIDLVGLYEISDSLTDDLKEFSFTFDDKNISLAQAVQTVCNVARVNVYRDGQMWRFNREEAKPRTYVFNRRNLASGDNQKYTQSVRLPNDYDSVSLRYYNRDIESFDEVLIRIDSGTQSFIVGEDGARPYELELAGCSNYAQALNRANLEARKIVYLRRGVEDVALIDAGNVDIGDRVAWCDIYDGETMDGEIVGQDGSTLYTSEEIVLEDGVTYYAMITDQDGQAMTPVEVAAVVGNSKAFTATLAGDVLIADNYLVQAGSKYIIGSVDDIDDTDYSVVSRGGNENGRISIELVQYSDNIYEAD